MLRGNDDGKTTTFSLLTVHLNVLFPHLDKVSVDLVGVQLGVVPGSSIDRRFLPNTKRFLRCCEPDPVWSP